MNSRSASRSPPTRRAACSSSAASPTAGCAHERLIEHCQGLWTDGTDLWTSGKSMLWRFRNDLAAGARTAKGADRRFVPRDRDRRRPSIRSRRNRRW
jgi:hypothetical protein